jgi:hypothetical protein
MKFQPGQSANPAGRPRGARKRRTIAAERLFDDAAEKLMKTVIGLAGEGHPVVPRLCTRLASSNNLKRTLKLIRQSTLPIRSRASLPQLGHPLSPQSPLSQYTFLHFLHLKTCCGSHAFLLPQLGHRLNDDMLRLANQEGFALRP